MAKKAKMRARASQAATRVRKPAAPLARVPQLEQVEEIEIEPVDDPSIKALQVISDLVANGSTPGIRQDALIVLERIMLENAAVEARK
jgi:hypothetical protein